MGYAPSVRDAKTTQRQFDAVSFAVRPSWFRSQGSTHNASHTRDGHGSFAARWLRNDSESILLSIIAGRIAFIIYTVLTSILYFFVWHCVCIRPWVSLVVSPHTTSTGGRQEGHQLHAPPPPQRRPPRIYVCASFRNGLYCLAPSHRSSSPAPCSTLDGKRNACAQSGMAQWSACWAPSPKVRGSKPRSASHLPGPGGAATVALRGCSSYLLPAPFAPLPIQLRASRLLPSPSPCPPA
jgi:hypothetical protein